MVTAITADTSVGDMLLSGSNRITFRATDKLTATPLTECDLKELLNWSIATTLDVNGTPILYCVYRLRKAPTDPMIAYIESV